MLAVGSLLAGVGALVVGLLALLFRHPRAPRWARSELLVMLAVVPISTLIGLGLGAMVVGSYAMARGGGDLRELAVPVVVAVLLVALWYASGIRKRLRAYALAAVDQPAGVVARGVMTLATDDQPPESPAPGRPPRRPTRKAA